MKRFFTYVAALIMPFMVLSQNWAVPRPKILIPETPVSTHREISVERPAAESAAMCEDDYYIIKIDKSSFRPVQTDYLWGADIGRINLYGSKRPIARIKINIDGMTKQDMSRLELWTDVDVISQEVAEDGSGLIVELTAKDPTVLCLYHPYSDESNEVSLELNGNSQFCINAKLHKVLPVVVSTNIAGADIYIDDEYQGKSDSDYTLTAYETVGAHKIRLEYGELKREIDVVVSDTERSFNVNLSNPSRPQYVVFQLTPSEAVVKVENSVYSPDSDGITHMLLGNGVYNYTVSANGYYDESGSFVVKDDKVEKSVTLRPAHGWLNVPGNSVLSGANIYVDGESIGTAPIENHKLSSGTHSVRIVKSYYKQFDGNVVINEGETLDYAPELVADFAFVSLDTEANSDIYINDKCVGKGYWQGGLVAGTYVFEARKEGHRPASISKSIEVTSSPQSYTIPTPTPILGTLNVVTSSAMADVYVDGNIVGRTPLIVDLVVGNHEVYIRKGELGVKKQIVTIEESKSVDLNLALTKLYENYVETALGLNMKMIYVEGGTFQMGATSEQGGDAYDDEKPVHSVTLDSYYIAECEVTQAQWYYVMGSYPSYYSGEDRPVESVSWERAQEFCRKLSEITGKNYTLPTEAQWEYAARGGNKSEGYKYSGSNTRGDVAWYYGNSSSQTHVVKQKQPNELGIYDMSGNVYEWCSDWYDGSYYSSSSQYNPTGPSSGSNRVRRGGDWDNNVNCRVSYRSLESPSQRDRYTGFRVVCLP